MFDKKLIQKALFDAIKKCAPQIQWRNPVMFIVYIGSILTTLIWFYQLFTPSVDNNTLFTGIITVWLWFTVLFANFAEALAEGRSKAQAASLKGVKNKVLLLV